MSRLARIIGDWSIQWVFVFSIAGYPIVAACSSILGIENRPLSIAVRGVVLALVAVAVVTYWPPTIKRENAFFWLAWWVFWIAYASRLVIDGALNPEALRMPFAEYFVFTFGVCLLPATVTSLGDVEITAKCVFNKLLFVAVLGMFLNLVFIFNGGGVGIDSVESLRAESDVFNPIAIGHLGVSIAILSFWRLTFPGQISLFWIMMMLVAAIIGGVGILSSGSRGPVLALVISLGVYAAVMPRYFFSVAFVGFLSAGLICITYLVSEGYEFFLFTRLVDGMFEDSARVALLAGAIDLISSNPLFGGGIDPLEAYPHNLVVESFLAYGLFTGLPFISLILFAVRRIGAVARFRKENFWVCLLFVQYLVGGMMSGSLYSSWGLFAMMVFVVSIPLSRAGYDSLSHVKDNFADTGETLIKSPHIRMV